MTARIDLTLAQVREIVVDQFPEYADLPVTNVEHSGWDNRTFRLGAFLSIRIPSADWYVAQVTKEQHWLPFLAPHLPVPIPVPVAIGKPTLDVPWPWSIYRWLPNEPLASTAVQDQKQLAIDLAEFLNSLYAIDARDGPPAGEHSFYRGSPPAAYDAQTRETIAELTDEVDTTAALAIWDKAIASEWTGEPVWFTGMSQSEIC